MYSWLWRRLPGPWWLKLVPLTVLAVLVIAMLFGLVFPWLDTVFVKDPTLG
jgi:hypothetical protein